MIAHDYGVDTETMTIRVGVNTDLSGAFAPLTTKITDGHLAYWEWINANGGIQGWTVEPVVRDNAYDVPTHLENYDVMSGTGDDSVVMFATSTGSPHTASTAESLVEDDMAAIPLSWYSGWADPEIGKNVFEVQTNYCIEAINGATYMSETYGDNVAIASFPGDYGEDGAEGVKVAAEALGLNIVYDGQAQVVPGADLTPVITGIAEFRSGLGVADHQPHHHSHPHGRRRAGWLRRSMVGQQPELEPGPAGHRGLQPSWPTRSTPTPPTRCCGTSARPRECRR